MSKPLEVDWDFAKALILQGITIKETAKKIGVKYGTLLRRLNRDQWRKGEQKADKALSEGALDDLIRNKADSWVRRVIGVSEKVLKSIEKRDPNKLKINDLRTLVEIADKTDQIGRRAFGMGDKPGVNINIGIVDYGSVSQGGQTSSEAPADQTIDIE